ncbi:MAG: hypothetical protein GF331_12225, partial [Chitinivibrionales bacterium]|nr:hypothetical protein [Chitinivibrionales bacterium]
MNRHGTLALAVLVVLALFGSAAIARRGEKPPEIDDNFVEIRYAPDKHEGETVIWGGHVGGVVRT